MKEDFYDAVVPSPLGRLGIHAAAEGLSAIEYVGHEVLFKPPVNALAKQTAQALERYFASGQLPQNLAMAPRGTAFQRRVWQALQDIPLGATWT